MFASPSSCAAFWVLDRDAALLLEASAVVSGTALRRQRCAQRKLTTCRRPSPVLITHRPTCSAVHARSQRRGLLVGYCCAPRLLEQSLSTFAAVCFACLNRRIVIPAPTRACLLARSPQAKGKEEGQMPPSSSRGTPPSTALKTPPPGESPKGGRGDTPKSDGSDSKKGLKVGSGSSRGGSGSERTKGAKPSARVF